MSVVIPAVFVTPGSYAFVMCINEPGTQLNGLQNDVLPLSVLDTGSDFSRYDGLNYGPVFPRHAILNVTS